MIIDNRESLKNVILYQKAGIFYFFDQNGVWQSGLISQINTYKRLKGFSILSDGRLFIYDSTIYYNQIIKNMAYRRMKEGYTIDDLEELLQTLKMAPKGTRKPKGIDRFICRIYRPEFHRLPDNTNTDTFDFIMVEVSIISEEAMENRDRYLKANITEIYRRAIKKLENDRTFIKYGVPINFLTISSTVLNRRTSILKIQFDLKEITEETE